MKTLEEILNQEPVFLHKWTCDFDVFMDFEDVYITYNEYIAKKPPYNNVAYWEDKKRQVTKALEKHKDDHILFASYGTDNWSGDAFVLFERDGILYEVNGSHCSCYGLEDQWEEEKTSIKALSHRLTEGALGHDDYSGNEFHDELCKFLGVERSN